VPSSVYNYAMGFMSGGLDSWNDTRNTSQRLLNVGFTFFVVVTLCSYTGNLAAFLTQEALLIRPVNSIQDAERAFLKVCAHEVLEEELRVMYPEVRWRFGILDSVEELETFMATQECDALVFSEHTFNTEPDIDAWRCRSDLVVVGQTVLRKAAAMPATQRVAQSLSYWMEELSIKKAAKGTFLDFEEAYNHAPRMCAMRGLRVFESDADEQLYLVNLAFPLMLFGACGGAAVILAHLTAIWRKTRAARLAKLRDWERRTRELGLTKRGSEGPGSKLSGARSLRKGMSQAMMDASERGDDQRSDSNI